MKLILIVVVVLVPYIGDDPIYVDPTGTGSTSAICTCLLLLQFWKYCEVFCLLPPSASFIMRIQGSMQGHSTAGSETAVTATSPLTQAVTVACLLAQVNVKVATVALRTHI